MIYSKIEPHNFTGFTTCQVLRDLSARHVGDLRSLLHLYLSTRSPNAILRSGNPRTLPEHQLLQVSQSHPRICYWWIANTTQISDVLSFYKEELAGENGNYISNEANKRGEKKIPVFRELAQDVSLCVSRVANILRGSGEAEAAFHCFIGGYVSFHTSFDSRYHLDDLFPSR